jgi:very-short-patch-repair endonuclease
MGIDQVLAARAGQQRSLVTAGDVAKAGGNRSHIRRRLHSGRWQLVHPGVFLIAGAPLDWATLQLAAVLSAGPGAAASHLAAARLWEIPGFATAGVELSVPRHRRRPRTGQRIHESSDLDRCRIVERCGVPVTDASRTILDLARYVGPRRLHRSIEALRRRDDVSWAALIDTLARHARQGRHGVRRLRQVILTHAHREEITDTDMELLVLSLIREAGLPEPTLHHRVLDGDRFVAEVDLAYPEHRIAIECDGSIHLVEDVRDRDLTRQNDLILLGWTVLRFSYERLRTRPEAVLAEIRAAIDAARAH